jgi:hypothetical protein
MGVAKTQEGANHRDIPEDGGNVGDKEEAMAIEDAEAPGGKDEHANAGKHDLDEVDDEIAFSAVVAGRDEVREEGTKQNAKENNNADANGQQTANDAGHAAGEFPVALGKKARINGDERSGEDALAKEVLKEIGDSDRGLEGVGGEGIAEIVCENALADEAGDAAEEDAGTYQKGGGARGAGGRRCGSAGHGEVDQPRGKRLKAKG